MVTLFSMRQQQALPSQRLSEGRVSLVSSSSSSCGWYTATRRRRRTVLVVAAFLLCWFCCCLNAAEATTSSYAVNTLKWLADDDHDGDNETFELSAQQQQQRQNDEALVDNKHHRMNEDSSRSTMQQHRIQQEEEETTTTFPHLTPFVRPADSVVSRAGIVDKVVVADGSNNITNTTYGICHIASFIPYSRLGPDKRSEVPYAALSGSGLAAIVLAVDMLNRGDGSVISELHELPQRCPIRFTLEAFDPAVNPPHTVRIVNELLNRDGSTSNITQQEPQPEVCAFLGSSHSTVTIPMAILTGIAGRPQLR